MIKCTFINEKQKELTIPYVVDFEINESYDDEIFTNILGEQYLIPKAKELKSFELSFFISENEIPFYDNNAPKTLEEIKSFFDNHRKEIKPLKVIIADEKNVFVDINCFCDYSYTSYDGAKDIPFKITIKEYKTL